MDAGTLAEYFSGHNTDATKWMSIGAPYESVSSFIKFLVSPEPSKVTPGILAVLTTDSIGKSARLVFRLAPVDLYFEP